MKYKECDIVFIKELNKEGMIFGKAIDLETKIEKYFVHIGADEDVICRDEDLEFITTLNDRIQEQINTPKA